MLNPAFLWARSRGVLSLRPKGRIKGYVLLSYLMRPFFLKESELGTHTNLWECREIARTFLNNGYAVDVIDWTNNSFIPKRSYRFAIDIHSNLERWAPQLPASCTKIFHITGAHWLYQNTAEYRRLLNLQQRRGKTLTPRRIAEPSYAIEHADVATILGNEFTQSTYAYAGKPMSRIPISTTHEFPFPVHRNIEASRKNFIWLGGGGMVHKGLDLVLEAFASLPEFQLSIFGNVAGEKDFEECYRKELYETPNIQVYGKVRLESDEFKKAVSESIAIVYPSCSEGGGGSVVTAMHAGLIPIVSHETSVDIGDFGILLAQNTVEEIKTAVVALAAEHTSALRRRTRASWEYARRHHTREAFKYTYRQFVDRCLEKAMRNL